MRFFPLSRFRTASIAAVALASPLAALAQLNFTTESVATYGGKHTAVDVTVTFQPATLTTSYLTLTINNLSDGGANYAYGTLVAFGLNYKSSYTLIPSGFTQTPVSGTDTTIEFTPFAPLSRADIDVDVGAETVSPNPNPKGLNGGSTAMFQFEFQGVYTNAALLDFFSGNESASGDAGQDFFFRMQQSGTTGVGNGSDKFFYVVPPEPIPEPSTFGVIAAAGLVALATLRRRVRRA